MISTRPENYEYPGLHQEIGWTGTDADVFSTPAHLILSASSCYHIVAAGELISHPSRGGNCNVIVGKAHHLLASPTLFQKHHAVSILQSHSIKTIPSALGERPACLGEPSSRANDCELADLLPVMHAFYADGSFRAPAHLIDSTCGTDSRASPSMFCSAQCSGGCLCIIRETCNARTYAALFEDLQGILVPQIDAVYPVDRARPSTRACLFQARFRTSDCEDANVGSETSENRTITGNPAPTHLVFAAVWSDRLCPCQDLPAIRCWLRGPDRAWHPWRSGTFSALREQGQAISIAEPGACERRHRACLPRHA
mmetsp:Transcript_96828/g.185888  ORF Transcript_96828/g.185888 Transcript_96828/m.185888 type:complete len:312 (-) Transcript_96828:174-1109(-)